MAGTSTSGIQFTGLASGLDTNALITAMLKVDQTRIDTLNQRRTTLDAQVSAIGTLRSKLSTLDDKLNALRFQSQVFTRSVTTDTPSGQAPIVSASADSTAQVGSFKLTVIQLATATHRTGATGVGDPSISTGAPLGQSGLALTPTQGKFTINGVQIDASAAATFDDFITAINAQTASTGVTASYVLDGAGNKVGVQLQNDAAHLGQSILAGSAGDTSNFLTAAKLSTAVQAGDTVQSTDTLGRLQLNIGLAAAHFATAPAASGTLTINGVDNAWTNGQTMSTVIANINSSAANVSASYDTVANRMVLTSKATGAQSITVADTAGNLGQALGLTNAAGGADALGQNAQYSIDTVAGGAVQTSTSNSVQGVVPGVTLNLQQASANPVTVTVAQDTSGPLAAMKDFVSAFNDAIDYIRTNQKADANGSPGAFQGDYTVQLLADNLRQMATNGVGGLTGPYRSLADLGVTTGPVGSAVGTTNDLVIDESKFATAMSTNPQAVYDLLNSPTGASTGVFTGLRTYLDAATLPNGLVQSMSDAAQATEKDVVQQISDDQDRLDQKRQRLQAQFAQMEATLSQLQSQGQQLQSQLTGLASAGSASSSSGSSSGAA
jgi:flagellar hook-associated protein 2